VTTLRRLTDWYQTQCNGLWEHSYGIRIDTLDNPGWSITINLAETSLETRAFAECEDRYLDEVNWLRCWREGAEFRAVCGPERLEDALLVFLDWAGA